MGGSDLQAVADVRERVAEVKQNRPPAPGHSAGHERMLEFERGDGAGRHPGH